MCCYNVAIRCTEWFPDHTSSTISSLPLARVVVKPKVSKSIIKARAVGHFLAFKALALSSMTPKEEEFDYYICKVVIICSAGFC